jgi:hypothetical protein
MLQCQFSVGVWVKLLMLRHLSGWLWTGWLFRDILYHIHMHITITEVIFMKKFCPRDLAEMSTEDLIRSMHDGELSILNTFRAVRLRLSMQPIGFICRFILWLILGNRPADRRNELSRKKHLICRVLKIIFPFRESGIQPPLTGSLVIGFNHPTLHEILSLIAWALDHFPDRSYNFPVNLPWYESLATSTAALQSLGIYITPLITPKTLGKIVRIRPGLDAADNQILLNIQKKFLDHYMKVAAQFALAGDHTFTAPSATRQATIFASRAAFRQESTIKLPPVMSLMYYSILRTKQLPVAHFLPISVLPPRRHTPGLNLFRKYLIVVNRPISFVDAASKIREKVFDHYFLKEIARPVPSRLWYPQT